MEFDDGQETAFVLVNVGLHYHPSGTKLPAPFNPTLEAEGIGAE
jgi:hypothetical protein